MSHRVRWYRKEINSNPIGIEEPVLHRDSVMGSLEKLIEKVRVDRLILDHGLEMQMAAG